MKLLFFKINWPQYNKHQAYENRGWIHFVVFFCGYCEKYGSIA